MALALLVPTLREYAPTTVVLLAIGGAWGTGAVAAARTVQVERDEDPRGETLHGLGPDEVDDFRIVTVRDVHDRSHLVDRFTDLGITLLDTHHPRRSGRHRRAPRRSWGRRGPTARNMSRVPKR